MYIGTILRLFEALNLVAETVTDPEWAGLLRHAGIVLTEPGAQATGHDPLLRFQI
jgi:hypothetical protein